MITVVCRFFSQQFQHDRNYIMFWMLFKWVLDMTLNPQEIIEVKVNDSMLKSATLILSFRLPEDMILPFDKFVIFFFFFFVAHYALSFPRWYFSPLDPCNPVLSLAAYLWLWPHLCSLVNLNYSKVPWPFFFALSQSHMHNFWTTSKKGFWFMRKVTAYPSSINADVDPRGGTDTCILPMVLNLLPCSQSSQYYRSIII